MIPRPPGPAPEHLPGGGRRWPGEGPPVVLVHGTGRSSRTLVPLGRRLAALGHPVLAPDLPSGDPAALQQAVLGLLAGLPPGPCLLVGLSGGCRVVADLAARAPERVAGLVLVGPPEPEPARRHARRVALGSLLEVPTLKPELLREHLAGRGRRAQLRRVAPVRWDTALPDVRCPSLVLRGVHDRVTSDRWARSVAGRLPHGRLLVVEGAAHDLHWSAPHVVARAVSALARGEDPQVPHLDSSDPLAPPHLVPTRVHAGLELATAALSVAVARRAPARTRAVLTAAGLAAAGNALVARHEGGLVQRVPLPLHLNLDSGGGLLLLLAAATVLRGEPRAARAATAALGLGTVLVADATSRPVGPARRA